MDVDQGATPAGGRLPDAVVRHLAGLRSNAHLLDVSTTPLLTPEECTDVVAGLDTDGWGRMGVWHSAGAPGEPHRAVERPDARRGRAQALPGGLDGPVGRRVAAQVLQVNEQIYRFRVVGFEEPVQVLCYGSENADGYGQHLDVGAAASLRKLSFSLLLSDPDTFEGGDLCFGDPFALARVQGTLTVFPSYLAHAVSPVTAGERLAIVGWVLGPAFS